MADTRQQVREAPPSTLAIPPVLAPVMMMAFWMLLGAAAGIRLMESAWRFLGVHVGEVSIVVPVGGVVGALVGALLKRAELLGLGFDLGGRLPSLFGFAIELLFYPAQNHWRRVYTRRSWPPRIDRDRCVDGSRIPARSGSDLALSVN